MPRNTLKLFACLLALLVGATEYDVHLHEGWNLVSVTRQGTTLSGIGGDAVHLPGFCLQRGSYVPVGAHDELQPGLAYWVFAARDLRSPQDSDDATGAPFIAAELNLTNLIGQVPGATTVPLVNDLAFAWRGDRYRAVFAGEIQAGVGYAVSPDPAAATLSIGASDPAVPVPGQPLTLIVSGAPYLAAGGVVWFSGIPAPILDFSATTIRVLPPVFFGDQELILDAGNGLVSSSFPLTVPSATPSLDTASIRNDLQDLVATAAATLGREHASINDSHIVAAQAHLLALDSLLDQILAGMGGATRDQILLLLENQSVQGQIAALDSAIAGRSIDPPETFASVQAALTSSQPHDLLASLADLRSSQLAFLAVTDSTDHLSGWLALDVIARIVETSHALTNWTPSTVASFRVDDSACDLPNACELRYFAEFAIAHSAELFRPPSDAILADLAGDLEALTASLPADFAFESSAPQLQADAAAQLQVALGVINDPALSSPVPAALLQRDQWTLEVDMQWMVANERGYFDLVLSQELRDCGETPVRVQINGETGATEVFAEAPGFARLDVSIFNRDRHRVFTANRDLTISPGTPTLDLQVPFTASSFLFDIESDDNVDAVSYTATLLPATPMSVACFAENATATLVAESTGIHFTTPVLRTTANGLEFSQSYLLEPGPQPFIQDLSYEVFAGTTTNLPISVIGFNLGNDTIPAEIRLDFSGRELTYPFELPLNSAFDNAIQIDVLQSQLGTAGIQPSTPLEFNLVYTVENTPGLTDIVTVVTGIDGIGPDLTVNPPNASVQDLRLSIVKAPLAATMDSAFVYDGLSVDFVVHREFGAELLPDELLALSVVVDPPDDITVGSNVISVARDAVPGDRTVSFTVGSETISQTLSIQEDRLSLFLFSELGYTGNTVEYFYFLESGSQPELEDVEFVVDPPDDIVVNDGFLTIDANAESSTRTFSMLYGAKSATATFTVVPEQLHIFPAAANVFEGSSYDLTLFFTSGKELTNPVVTVDPADDVSIEGTTITFGFGAAVGARTVSVTANGVTGEGSVTVVDDTLQLDAESTGAFPGSSIEFMVSRASDNAVVGQPVLSVNPPGDIVVNGMTLEIANSAALGPRTVTVTLGNESADLTINVLGDAEYVAIELSAGANAASYPVTRFNTLPAELPDSYKTSSLLLRRVSNSNFTMGSPLTEVGRFTDEVEHAVTFSGHYYIGVFEVTQRQYELVTGTRPSGNAPNDYEMLPVENLSYSDIRGTVSGANWPSSNSVDSSSFVGLLRARTGLDLDLPTEAQWENACRAGTSTALNDGNNLSDANVDANLDLLGRYSNNASGTSGPVGAFQPNALGIYDMHGNVWEWCLDWYASYGAAVTDPFGGISGSNRVLRGGSYLLGARYARSANRGQLNPASKNIFFGFRLAGPGSMGLAD